MLIYVAGPYSADIKAERDHNVTVADEIGRILTKKGHVPFVPHKMTWRWEEDADLSYDDFLRVDFVFLNLCDALFFIGPSPGANKELAQAQQQGKRIFYSLSEVPVVVQREQSQ